MEIKLLRQQLVRNRILIETLWHPEVKKYRTLIRLNHPQIYEFLEAIAMTSAKFFKQENISFC